MWVVKIEGRGAGWLMKGVTKTDFGIVFGRVALSETSMIYRSILPWIEMDYCISIG